MLQRTGRLAVASAVLLVALAPVGPPSQAVWPGAQGMISYVGGVGGFSPDHQVYVINADGSGRHRLTDYGGNGIFRPAWSPSGNRLLAWEQESFGGSGTTVALNADGTGRLPVSSEAIKASWSPDGSRLVYVAPVNGIEQVVTVAANGTGRAQVASIPPYKWIARWSPTDDRIAFGSSHLSFSPDPDDWYGGISVIDADASPTSGAAAANRVKIVDINGYVDELDWSPDGTKIAFIAQPCSLVPPDPALDCDGGFGGPGPEYHRNVYVVTVATGDVDAITLNRNDWTSVAWSPDGSRLAATVNKGAGGNPAVVTMPAAGGAFTTVIEPGFGEHCTDNGCAQVPQSVTSVDWQPCVAATTSCQAVTSADVTGGLDGPTDAAPLQDLSYTARLANNGPDAAPGTTLGLEWSGATLLSVDAQLPCTLGTNTLVCSAGALGRDVVREVTLNLKAPAAPGTVHVTARGTMTIPDTSPGNDVSTVDTVIAAAETPTPSPTPTASATAAPTAPTASVPTPGTPGSSATPPERMRTPGVEVRGRRVVVTWKAADANGSPVTGYVVDISRGTDKTRPASARRAVFKGLEPGRYKFRVAARNAVGTSPYSARVRIRLTG